MMIWLGRIVQAVVLLFVISVIPAAIRDMRETFIPLAFSTKRDSVRPQGIARDTKVA
jgi:hypothetical protein